MDKLEVAESAEQLIPQHTYWATAEVLHSDYTWGEVRIEAAEADATLISSLCKSGDHAPVLDLDHQAELEYLEVPGYGVLRVDHQTEPAAYRKLLRTMSSVGLVSRGYARALIAATPVTPPLVLGLRVPSRLLPSSTPGHNHLYIDTEMPWRSYRRFLGALAGAGVIERGFYKASVERQQTMLRKPGVYKDTSSH